MNLRQELVRLAHENPEIRGLIMPLLEAEGKTASKAEAALDKAEAAIKQAAMQAMYGMSEYALSEVGKGLGQISIAMTEMGEDKQARAVRAIAANLMRKYKG
jgi:hypothetical protein